MVRVRIAESLDAPKLAALDQQVYRDFDMWNERDYKLNLNEESFKCVLAIENNHVIGLICARIGTKIKLMRVAVDIFCRRKGIATLMYNKLTQDCQNLPVIADVPEDALDAQLFFKSLGLRYTETKYARHQTYYQFKTQVQYA